MRVKVRLLHLCPLRFGWWCEPVAWEPQNMTTLGRVFLLAYWTQFMVQRPRNCERGFVHCISAMRSRRVPRKRKMLVELVGATGECAASVDSDFEEKAKALLEASYDAEHNAKSI